jgi:predicted molibdopterin-dependent oxidoreductase YjgC
VENFLGTLREVEEDPKKRPSDGGMTDAAVMLRGLENPVVIVGTGLLRRDDTQGLLGAVKKLAETIGARVVVLPPQNNLYGSLLAGAHTGVLPGAVPSGDKKHAKRLAKVWGIDAVDFATPKAAAFPTEQKTKVLYLVGDVPGTKRPKTDFLIYQNIYPLPDGVAANLTLPSAAFAEADGTFVNGEGRVQTVTKAVEPPGDALPDWDILCRIARKMGKPGFDFKNVKAIQKEMSEFVDAYGKVKKARLDLVPLRLENGAAGKRPGKRAASAAEPLTEHTYKGFDIGEFVGGAAELFANDDADAN